MRSFWRLLAAACVLVAWFSAAFAAEPAADWILHGGRVVTVDKDFRVAEALAVRNGRIVAVGSDRQVLALRGPQTRTLDLQGKMVLPGLIDSHVHPPGAALTEFDHPIPEMRSIADVLEYIRRRTQVVPKGKWIVVRQVFITRLKERRYPTREELDRVAPEHPVLFATGPDGSLNSLALRLSGIDKDFQVVGTGYIERDPRTGEPTGILRGCLRYVKAQPYQARRPNHEQALQRLELLLKDYASVGLTTVADRSAGLSNQRRYQELLEQDRLVVRVMLSRRLLTSGTLEEIQRRIDQIAKDPLRQGSLRLRIIGVKTFLDGGMLTGSAYMRKPWGVSRIYGIRDPRYRGVRMISEEMLPKIVRRVAEAGLQFTAHSVGDGAVHALLEAYAQLPESLRKQTRPCITHCNFMSREAVEQMAALGVVADIQPAWLYLDTPTLLAHFGRKRLRYFQPLRSLFEAGAVAGGGSDHMQKIGSFRAINPYNPFLGMWVTITRRGRDFQEPLYPQEALTRQQAIRFYTINNAYLLFAEKEIGSLEVGKRADLIVIDRDLLRCAVEEIPRTRVLLTMIDGKVVHRRGEFASSQEERH